MTAHTAESITRGIDLSGKVALVTGINSGIGFETARVLAMRGAKVLGTARDLARATEASRRITGDVLPYACELTSREDVQACAKSILADHPAIDIVVANAGIMALPQLETVDRTEKQLATNHFGHFLLINLLLPALGTSRPCRVVMVSSAAHLQAPSAGIEFDNLDGSKGYSGWRAYGQSKLANILFANELAKRLPQGSTANALHPGMIRTNLGRHMGGPLSVIMGLTLWPFMISIERGAATSCYLAAHPEVSGKSGRYFANCREATPSRLARDEALARRLWDVTVERLGLA